MSEKKELSEEQIKQLEAYRDNCSYNISIRKVKGEEGQSVSISGDKKSVFSAIELLFHILLKNGVEKKEILQIIDYAEEHKNED